MPPCSLHRPDSDGLQALVEELKLVALNTWHTSKPHTFVQGSSLSQIDFVFTKEIESGSRAKLATPLHDWHLGSWKVGGHLPIAATIQSYGCFPHLRSLPNMTYSNCSVQYARVRTRRKL